MATATAATSEKLRTAGIGVSAARPKARVSEAAASVMDGPAVASAAPMRAGSGMLTGCLSTAWLIMNRLSTPTARIRKGMTCATVSEPGQLRHPGLETV